jgi:hypothetical protein
MKRLWAALVLFVLVMAVCVLGIFHTERVTAQMVQNVTAAKEAQERGDGKAALQLSREAVQNWRADHPVLCMYMVHSRLENIDQTLSALPELCRNGAKDAFLSECDKGLAQLSYLTELEIPNLENIL